MKFKFDFVRELWIRGVEVEADTMEDAIDVISQLSVKDLLEDHEGYIKASEDRDHSADIMTANYDIQVTDVKYHITDIDAPEDLPENEINKWIEDTIRSLPTKFNFTINDVSDEDLDDIINERISDETDYLTDSIEYDIINRY